MENFLIIGGDKRQKVLYDLLISAGKDVSFLTMKDTDIISRYSHIILPVPVSRDGRKIYCQDESISLTFEKLTDMLTPEQTVLGGSFHGRLKALLENKKIRYHDLLTDESFLSANAFLTAQGALRLLLENTEEYLAGKKILIIGFGRVAKALAGILAATGADVYIAARNPSQLQTAEYCSYKTVRLNELDGRLCEFSYVFGTVPFNVLTEDNIRLIRDDCVYFELASAPFTADRNFFTFYGKKFVYGGALPGRYLPVASGRLLFEYILSYISVHRE